MAMTDNVKICDFCNKETKYVPLTVGYKSRSLGFTTGGPKPRTIKVHFCSGCQAEYVFWGDNPSVNLYTTVNGNLYRWSKDTLLGNAGRLWHVKDPGIPGIKQNSNLHMLKSFDVDIPDITPHNVNEKVRFMLLWL